MKRLRLFIREVSFRLRWRAALSRLAVEPRSVKLVKVVERSDGFASTLTVESRTREALQLFTESGVDRLSWALDSRVVLLGGDPYRPTAHLLLVESAPLSAGHLPPPPPVQWGQSVRTIPIGLHATTAMPMSLDLWSSRRGSAHVLVAGTTGGGKSNTVGVLIAGLVASGACVVGIDCKAGETLFPWSYVLGHPVVDPSTEPQACDDLLARLVALMERRQRWPGPSYRPVVLVVEEWAALPIKPTAVGDNLERLAAQGRSASVGLIVTTQRPTSNVGAVRTSTRGNLTLRIAHSTIGDRAASEAILGAGHYEAAELPTEPPGLALVRMGGATPEPVRVFQCDGPPWALSPLVFTLDEVEAWDLAVQREMELFGEG